MRCNVKIQFSSERQLSVIQISPLTYLLLITSYLLNSNCLTQDPGLSLFQSHLWDISIQRSFLATHSRGS